MNQHKSGITGNIITLNEEQDIAACVASLRPICDEIIVIDSNSTDRTVEIAESLGARVVRQAYLGDGCQKNVALAHATTDWILSIDADERLTPDAISKIRGLNLQDTPYDAFALRRRNYIGSRWIRWCGWYPDYCIRLYNRRLTRFAEVREHATVQARNPCRLEADLIHYTCQSVGELFAKPERNFSSRAAKIMYRNGQRASAFSACAHGLGAFLYRYTIRGGVLGGVDGMTVALATAVNSYLKYAKLLEYQRDPKVLDAENFDKVW